MSSHKKKTIDPLELLQPVGIELDLSHPGLRKILRLALSWGIKNFDDKVLRTIMVEYLAKIGGQFFDVSDPEIKDYLKFYTTKYLI